MRSIQVTAPGALAVVDVEAPSRGGAVVAVETAGICGTDVKILAGKIETGFPRIMGHEAIGRVVEAGPLGLVQPGDRVLVDPAISCGYCALCREGRPNLCLNGGLLGRDADGVFAEKVSAPEERLISVPDSIDDDASGLLQVCGTTIHAIRSVRVDPGDTVVVIGLGVAGQLLVQLLAAEGATVIGVTRSAWKREIAARLGASAVCPPDEARSAVADLTGGAGADFAFEAAGTEATLGQAIELTRVGGEVVVFGTLTGGNMGLPYYQLYFKELTIRNPRAAVASDYERAISLAAAGTLDLAPLVTHRFTLEEAADAFEAVTDSDSMKVLIRP